MIPNSFQEILNNTELGMAEMFLGHAHHMRAAAEKQNLTGATWWSQGLCFLSQKSGSLPWYSVLRSQD